MKINIFIILSICLQYFSLFSQTDDEWFNFTGSQNIKAIVRDWNYIWVGGEGLTRVNVEDNYFIWYRKADSGLPDDSVLSLVFDKNKILWIGTRAGVTKFDGKNFTTYSKTFDGRAIRSVNVLAVDSNNNIWAGSGNKLYCFLTENWISVEPESTDNFPELNNISSIAVDSNNTVFIGMDDENNDCRLITFKNQIWSYFDCDNSKIPDSDIKRIYVSDNVIWFLSKDGIYNFRNHEFSGFIDVGYDLKYVNCFNIKYNVLTIPIGNGDYKNGKIIYFDVLKSEVFHVLDDIPYSQTRDIIIDKNYNLWITNAIYTQNKNGLAKYNKYIWRTINISEFAFSSENIESIAIDSSGNIWCSPWGCGISKFDGTNWHHYENKNLYLLSEYVEQIEVDKYNRVWVLTHGGINVIDSNNNWKQYDYKQSILKNNYIDFMMADTDGSMWLGGDNLLNLKDDKLTVYPFRDSAFAKRNWSSIFSMAKDLNNNFYLGLWDGFAILDRQKNVLEVEKEPVLKFGDIHSIAFDKDNVMWLSDYNFLPPFDNYDTDHSRGCIIKFDGATTYYDSTNSSLTRSIAETIKIDKDNIKWFATWDGLGYYDGKEWGLFTVDNSFLPENYINTLAFDKYGNLWIGTWRGLAVYRKGGVIMKKPF